MEWECKLGGKRKIKLARKVSQSFPVYEFKFDVSVGNTYAWFSTYLKTELTINILCLYSFYSNNHYGGRVVTQSSHTHTQRDFRLSRKENEMHAAARQKKRRLIQNGNLAVRQAGRKIFCKQEIIK